VEVIVEAAGNDGVAGDEGRHGAAEPAIAGAG
jgi:hypothetical protein